MPPIASTRSWTRPCLIALALVPPLAACGDGDGDGSGGIVDGDPVPKDDAPEAASASFCEAWVTCDCADYPDSFANQAACESSVEADFAAEIAAADAAGLTYDADCMGDLLATYDSFGCTTLAELLEEPETLVALYTACKPFYGDDAAGTACTDAQDVPGDSCAQGLRCEDAVCVTLALKDAGESCSFGDICEGGTYCVPVETLEEPVCAALPGIGGTCLGPTDACDFAAYCDQGDKTCKALPAVGQSCEMALRCAKNAFCEDMMCRAAPEAGEPCTEVCASGSTCVGEVCRVDAPLVCGASLD